MYRILAAVRASRCANDEISSLTPATLQARNSWHATAPERNLVVAMITRLLGPKRWTYFYLYVLLDIFSRYAVGWMVAERA